MSLKSRQWLFACILDVCIKIVYAYCAFFLLTVIAAPVAPFIYIGVAISVHHFFVSVSRPQHCGLARIDPHRAGSCLAVSVGTDAYQGIICREPKYALHDDDDQAGEIGRTAIGGVGINLFLMVTNLVTLTTGFGCMMSHARRSL